MKLHINKEEKFVFILVIITIAFLFVRGQFLAHEEEAVETAYEAGYSACLEDTKDLLTVVETYEDDKGVHITLKYQDGEIHEYLSPVALG